MRYLKAVILEGLAMLFGGSLLSNYHLHHSMHVYSKPLKRKSNLNINIFSANSKDHFLDSFHLICVWKNRGVRIFPKKNSGSCCRSPCSGQVPYVDQINLKNNKSMVGVGVGERKMKVDVSERHITCTW